jgi:ribosomal protein S8
MNELTQISDVLTHLQEKGSITSLESIKLFGATRISAIIYVLRKRGYIIDTIIEKGKTRHNRPTQWARYIYKGRVASENRSN